MNGDTHRKAQLPVFRRKKNIPHESTTMLESLGIDDSIDYRVDPPDRKGLQFDPFLIAADRSFHVTKYFKTHLPHITSFKDPEIQRLLIKCNFACHRLRWQQICHSRDGNGCRGLRR